MSNGERERKEGKVETTTNSSKLSSSWARDILYPPTAAAATAAEFANYFRVEREKRKILGGRKVVTNLEN